MQRLAFTCSMVELHGLGYAYGEDGLRESLKAEMKRSYDWYWSTWPQDRPATPSLIYCQGGNGDDDTILKVLTEEGFIKVMEYPSPHSGCKHNVKVYMKPGVKNAAA